jgi:hypothetical protein
MVNALETALAEMGNLSLKADRQTRALAARSYDRRRSEYTLSRFLPPDLFCLALADQDSPAVTWMVIGHLCQSLRYDRRAGRSWGMWGDAAVNAKRQLVTCELHLLARQKAVAAIPLSQAAE